ncbi:hypothetical protein MPB2EB_1515 [Mycoavidus sp. B2-EB]|nr:hypothetical protein MPB2EB_1515 [Mycoavidus sp. B2-EB]
MIDLVLHDAKILFRLTHIGRFEEIKALSRPLI